eukprot:m.74832 g.74832  ORF g.74832 m.74832 type:complete len:249 (-) comp17131_c0_seq2:226-972(-)
MRHKLLAKHSLFLFFFCFGCLLLHPVRGPLQAPPDAVLDWDTNAIQGVSRWLQRLWALALETRTASQHTVNVDDSALRLATHTAIKAVTHAFSTTHAFNVAVAELMKLSNTLRAHPQKNSPCFFESVRTLLVLLSPMAPHIASELWEGLQSLPLYRLPFRPQDPILMQSWPAVDEDALCADTFEIGLQVDGKHRGSIPLPSRLRGHPRDIEVAVLATDLGRKWVPDPTKITKVVIPPKGHIVSIVLSS